MKASKFFQSLQFRLIAIVTLIFLASNIVIVTVAMRLSTKSTNDSVDALLNAVAKSASEKIKAQEEKNFRMLNALALSDFLKDESLPLREKCAQLTKIAKVSDEYENIGFYDLDGNGFTADGRAINLKRAYIDNAAVGKTTITDPAVNPITNVLFQIYAAPVYDDNKKIIGCISLNIYGDVLSKTIESISFGESDTHIQVISRTTGHTIASNNFEQVTSFQNVNDDADESVKPVLARVMNGETGHQVFGLPGGGNKMIAAFCPIPGTDWSVFGACQYEDFYSEIETMKSAIYILSIIMIAVAFCAVGAAMSISLKPLKTVKAAIEDVASGEADLTKRIKKRGNDEVSDVVVEFNRFMEKLHEIIAQIKDSNKNLGGAGVSMQDSAQDTAASITQIIANIQSMRGQIGNQTKSVDQTAAAVNQIASNIESLERMIEGQSSGVTQASAAVEEMIGNISSVNQSVEKMAASFKSLEENTQSGIVKQQAVDEQIRSIENQSAMLQEANQAISAIAEQTNLLAMNAAIEAAHAGDAGKGFAVVADEIRKLSETSGSQSKTIGEQLNKIQESIEAVVKASADSNQAFSSVSEQINDTDQLITQIRSAMQEQQEGSTQIIDDLQSMNNSASEVGAAASEMSEGNQMILREVSALQEFTRAMNGSMEEMSIGAEKINETASALTTIAADVKDSIDQIGGQIDQFKV